MAEWQKRAAELASHPDDVHLNQFEPIFGLY